MKLSAVVEGSL